MKQPLITLSAWNDFWLEYLQAGLARRGFGTRVLSTRKYQKLAGAEYCWLSDILTRAYQRLSYMRTPVLEAALYNYENFAAARCLDTPCFWGWSGHHLKAFRRAKNVGIPLVLESGSTHPLWQWNVLKTEHERAGIPFSEQKPGARRIKMLKEIELADHICVPSTFVASTYRTHGVPEDKLAINPYGANVAAWSQVIRRQKKGTEPFIVVYTASLIYRKGARYLLKAWKRAALSNAELWIVGGVFVPVQELEGGTLPNIHILGFKSHEELAKIYETADAYVLPSLEEGLARSVIEAMAAGLPIIVTEETGARDVTGSRECGWIVPSQDTEALADAFQDAAHNRDRTFVWGQNARLAALPFTWDAYGDRAGAFLETIIGPPQGKNNPETNLSPMDSREEL